MGECDPDGGCELDDAGCPALPTEVLPWLAPGASHCERVRLVMALRRVCDRLLVLQPQQRPRSLDALGSVARRAAGSICTFTVDPAALGRELDIPEKVRSLLSEIEVFCGEDVLEPLPDATVHEAQRKWAVLSNSEGLSSDAEVARWVQSQAFVRQGFAPLDIARALCDLGLLQRGDSGAVDCTRLRRQAVDRKLPQRLPERPWYQMKRDMTACRVVRLPAGYSTSYAGVVIGPRGAAIASLSRHLAQGEHSCGNGFSVSLGFSGDSVRARICWSKWCAPQEATNVADGVAAELLRHLLQVPEELRALRAARQARLLEEGMAYHRQLRAARAVRQRSFESVRRALSLPGSGVDGFGACFIRRLWAPHKDRGVARRQSWLRAKRRTLQRARAELVPVPRTRPCDGLMPWFAPQRAPEKEAVFQELLETAHLDSLSRAGSLCFRPHSPQQRVSSAARRLQRHVVAMARAAGAAGLPAAAPVAHRPPTFIGINENRQPSNKQRDRAGRRAKPERRRRAFAAEAAAALCELPL